MKSSKTAWWFSTATASSSSAKSTCNRSIKSSTPKAAWSRLGFIDTHFHSGINASDYILADSTKTDFFASNYLAHGGPTREGAHSAHLKDVDIGQRFSLIHVLKSGVTTTFDIGGAGGEPARYVDMIDQVGIRCVAGPSYKNVAFFHDKAGRLEYDWNDERGSKGLQTAVDFAKKFNGACSGRMTAMLFPGHVDSCTPALLKETKTAAKDAGVGIQIHATINLFEFHTVMQRERCTPIELLKKLGFLAPDVSLSHCIFVSGHSWLAYPYGDDLKIIADSGASVAYSPLKYLKLGILMESFDRYRQAGINMGIGTDTFPKDILSDMRYAGIASRIADKSFLAGHPRDVFNSITLGGAKMIGRDDIGRLAKGRQSRHRHCQSARHCLRRRARSDPLADGNRRQPRRPHRHSRRRNAGRQRQISAPGRTGAARQSSGQGRTGLGQRRQVALDRQTDRRSGAAEFSDEVAICAAG